MFESVVYYCVVDLHTRKDSPMNATVVRSIRLPKELWDEIKSNAEITDRSLNRVVLRMLQKQVEQEKKAVKKESRAI